MRWKNFENFIHRYITIIIITYEKPANYIRRFLRYNYRMTRMEESQTSK